MAKYRRWEVYDLSFDSGNLFFIFVFKFNVFYVLTDKYGKRHNAARCHQQSRFVSLSEVWLQSGTCRVEFL